MRRPTLGAQPDAYTIAGNRRRCDGSGLVSEPAQQPAQALAEPDGDAAEDDRAIRRPNGDELD
jgi:hypothetical protein